MSYKISTEEGNVLNSGSYTKHECVKNDLLKRIDSGEFSDSGKVPSENELCREYSISIITARKVLWDLTYTGRIVRIRGKGSFLTEHLDAHVINNAVRSSKGIISLILNSYDKPDKPIMEIIRGVQKALSRRGYAMTIECSNRNAKTEAEILERIVHDKAEGVLVFSTDPEGNVSHFISLDEAGIPFVMLDRDLKSYPCTMVASYNFDGMYKMTEHLIGLGHRNIAYLANELPTSVHEDRFSGYQMALMRHKIEFNEKICFTDICPQKHLLPDLIRENKISAIICINDHFALEIFDYLRKQGFFIPEDVSITGFDDMTTAEFAGLTTARQKFCDIGALAAERLLDLIEKKANHSHTLLPVDIIVRESTGAPKEQSGD